MKRLVEQFNSVNVEKDEELKESCENSVLTEEVISIAKQNRDDKRVRKYTDKFSI